MSDMISAPALDLPRRTARRPLHKSSAFLTVLIAGIALLPLITLASIALTGGLEDWPHLAQNVLPGALVTTVQLLFMVGALTIVLGVATAWLVVGYDFPMRRNLSWLLVLPLAIPPYLAAYAFADFFHFSGPIQSGIRSIFGFTSGRDYWFPDIRSTGGAALVMSLVLYPYIYMTSRVVFLMQGRNVADVARTLGAGPSRVFWRVLLPISRPAIAAGLTLVLMETINDIGASEFLGVRTLTFLIFSTWLNRGSLEGAAQLAMVMIVIVFGLVMAEQWARRRQRFHAQRATQIMASPPRIHLQGWRGILATSLTSLPVLAGFGIPLYVFGRYASRRLEQFTDPVLLRALGHSVQTAIVTAVVTICAALLLVNAARLMHSRFVRVTTRFAMIGYAIPGTIIALGLLFSLARFDNALDAMMRSTFGISTGLLISGSFLAVVLACSIRFLALAEGSIRSGMERLPPNLDEAAQILGRTPAQSAIHVLLPMLRPALLTGLVLVFVDTVKELSATILLRPFGFNTLATFVYENASRGVVEDTGPAALVIIATATIPIFLLSRALMRDGNASIS